MGSRGAGTTLTHVVSDVVPLAAGEAEWDKKSDCRVKVEVHMVQRTGCGSGFGQDRRKHRKWYRPESQNPSCPWRAEKAFRQTSYAVNKVRGPRTSKKKVPARPLDCTYWAFSFAMLGVSYETSSRLDESYV